MLIASADSTWRHSCSFLMRSDISVLSAALALARLLSAIEDFSVTATICSFSAKVISALPIPQEGASAA